MRDRHVMSSVMRQEIDEIGYTTPEAPEQDFFEYTFRDNCP